MGSSVGMALRTALAVAASFAAGSAAAQPAFPSKPIRFISCCTGFPETTARVIASRITEQTGHQVVVEAKPGANGVIAAEYVAASAPDGYTILIGTNSTHAANQSLFRKLPYDSVRDFTPVSGISQGTLLLVVKPSLQVKSVAELTALAKRSPGKLSYGWGSSSTRAGVELYKIKSGIQITDVPYKTNPQAATDLLGGSIDLVMSDLVSLKQHVDAGTMRPLAVSGPRRAAALPDVPTMQEAGVDGYDLTFWLGAWLPAKTPPSLTESVNRLFVGALQSAEVKEFLAKAGSEAFPTTSDELMKFQLAEQKKWRDIVTAAGIAVE